MADDSTRSAPPDPTPVERATPFAPTNTGAPDGSFEASTDPAAPAPRPEPPPGFDLLEEVGRGGMGVVYRARDRALNRTVAVKYLKEVLTADGAAAQRFAQEAQITSQLQHPGVPPVHQVGALGNGRPYLVMKLVKGETLQAKLRGCRTAAERGRFLAAFERVCQTVGYAHANRVIHRDLKPSNVMVGAFGEVQVMDWGLAKSLTDPPAEPPAPAAPGAGTEIRSSRDSDSATLAGSVLGTPAFMPPEQAGGEIPLIDERADVFGLGAVLCVILTGEPPYTAREAEAVRLMSVRGQLADAHARLDGCGGDPELIALCRRCLSPARADRPRDANELAAAVADLRAAAEERARAAERARDRAEAEHREQRELDRVRAEAAARQQRERRKVQIAVAGAVALLLAAGGAFAWWQDRQSAERREADLRAEIETQRRDAERREHLARNGDAVAALLGACEAALRADDAPAARMAFDQARTRVADGGTEHLADRLARCGAELDLLLELDRLEDLRWTVIGGKLQGGVPAASHLPAAFARFGIVPGTTPPDGAARRLAAALVRDRALTALDDWLAWNPSAELLAVLRAADPDPYRDAVRAAVAGRAAHRVVELAARPAALNQEPRFAKPFGALEVIAPPRRRQLLLAALPARPGDYRLLLTLGQLCAIHTIETAAERETWFRAALAVRPKSAVAHNYLGIALLDRGDVDGAIGAFRDAVRYGDGYVSAYSNLGKALLDGDQFAASAEACRKALDINPRFEMAYSNLGIALYHLGDPDGAIAACHKAICLDPDLSIAYSNLALALRAKGDVAPARAAFAEAARCAGDSPAALNRIAWPLAVAPEDGVRDGHRAVELASRACELSGWKVGIYIDTLAAACAETGDFERAVEYEKRALAVLPSGSPYGAASGQRLALYEQRKPYRAPFRVTAPAPRPK